MDHASITEILSTGIITLHGMFLKGSNYTFLARVEKYGEKLEAVYKPARGEQPLWDFPAKSLGKREAAAYIVSVSLGWDLVPPTVYRNKKAPLGPGSLQMFFRHDPLVHFFTLPVGNRGKIPTICTFDLMVNNADRKGDHVLLDEKGHIWCIDQGLCFHEQDKLRTVIWDLGGQPIPEPLLADIHRMEQKLAIDGDLQTSLKHLLHPAEIGMLRERCRRILNHPVFPVYDQSRRMVPYPTL